MIFAALIIQALRCLDLYRLDDEFVRSIYVAKNIVKSIESMLEIYPCNSLDSLRVLNMVKAGCETAEIENQKLTCKPCNTSETTNIR